GDEFVVIAEGMSGRSEAGELAERLLDAVSRPLSSVDCPVVTASVGITLMTAATDPTEAIRQADCAMYAAKRAGPNGCRFYAGAAPARAGRRQVMARALRGAEMRGEMRLVFQPVFDFKRDAIIGVEA